MPVFIFMNTETTMAMIQPFLTDSMSQQTTEATAFVVQCQSLAGILKIFLIFSSGYMFDIFGRRFIIFTCFLLIGVLLIIIPYMPNLVALKALFISWNLLFEPLMQTPLIQDYAHPSTFGRAVALFQYGVCIGMISALIGLINLS